MSDKEKNEFIFPVGYHAFHKDQLFNFQLNRWFSLGYTRLEDMEEVGKKIKSFKGWKFEMLKLAEKAVAENRLMNAAFYYRAAEFYTTSKDPEKELLYDKFSELFYEVFKNDEIGRYQVPYEGTFLPVLRIASTVEKKGTILIHGGLFYRRMVFNDEIFFKSWL